MIWGSKEGIYTFLDKLKIKNDFQTFMSKNNNENKAGIYLCIGTNKKIGYLIIWPGYFSYQYSKINEAYNSMLRTLIRYGFYISSNSILCFTKNEINNLDERGYSIFDEIKSRSYFSTSIIINNDDYEEKEKHFQINEKRKLTEEIEDINDKKIIKSIINHNIILFFEESCNNISKEIKGKDIYEYIANDSKFDLIFEKDFEINNPEIFYLIIKHNSYYRNNNNKKKCYTYRQLMDCYEEKIYFIINNIFKQLNEELFIEKKCIYCNKSLKDSLLDLYIEIGNNNSIKYFHENCYKNNNNTDNFNFPLFDENEKYKLYEKYKENILNNNYEIDKEIIKEFFSNFESQNFLLTGKKKALDYKNYLHEIDKLRKKLLDSENMKMVIMEEEINHYESVKTDENSIKSWIEKWKQDINNYYQINKNKINKWIVMKQYNINNKKLSYEYKETNNIQSIVNLYKFMSYRDSNDLKLVNKDILGRKINEKIENYFSDEDKGLIIYKDGNKNKIFLNERDCITFEGIYDFDSMSETLIICKNENNKRKIGIYENKNKKDNNYNFKFYKDLDINSLRDKIIKKIILIPCIKGYKEQSVLLFIENEIKLFNSSEIKKTINLKDYFTFNNFEQLQFLVYKDFILILKFYDNSMAWKGKLFSLVFEDESIFDEIKNVNIELKACKNAKFSYGEIRNKKYIFSLSYEDDKPIINYWEINCQLSGAFTSSSTTEEEVDKIEQLIPLGNCLLNYFYHCFDKYPLLGAIEYNFIKYENSKKLLKLSFFTEKNDIIPKLKYYINELKKICEERKKINFDDVFDFSVNDFYLNYKDKDISLGKLLIKSLEIVPIQIAKIMGNRFKIISNGENIDNILNIAIEKKRSHGLDLTFTTEEYAKLIHFCIKESIFSFELPAVVICCFGTQSIGKSTFLNEITGALFDVSGMRCTEGIWMAVKLFNHTSKMNINQCNGNCSVCKVNRCYLINEHIKSECICENCICGQDCQMKGKKYNPNCCDLKCSLKKGHEELSKCVFENCECKCKCNCICKSTKSHRHICSICKNKKEKCNCECTCKHFCKYPIIMHDFLCISLDFEGIGTFERTNDQDIQMALIGAAMGNAIIFRTHNSYDKFTDDTMENLYQGSNKIPKSNIEDFFGGSLFFCPRDVNETHYEGLKKEFQEKIDTSAKKWNMEFKKENKKYKIFGLFNSYFFASTAMYFNKNFYKNLREELTYSLIVKSFKINRHPIYETGKHFCSNLKIFLSVVSMNNYEFLSGLRENEIKNYIKENQNKAYEVLGDYEFGEELEQIDYITKLNDLSIYFNKNYLKHLEIDLKDNKKFQENDTLLIDNIYSPDNIQGNYNIEEYGIILNIQKKDDNHYLFSIDNLYDFGLILSVPKKIDKINSNDLCHDFLLLWSNICKKINLSEKNILENFEFFISSLIERRNQNINKWLQELTKNNNNILEAQNQNIFLTQNWRICKIKCNFCCLICCKLTGHQDMHECPYDHKCKENCKICLIVKCNENNCKNVCKKEAGHFDDKHICEHFHKCLNNCQYYDNCKKKCILEYDHEGDHRCELSTHNCNEKCSLSEISRGCGGNCTLPYPHKNQAHNCQKQHYCKEECILKDKRDCNQICSKIYGHTDNKHECGKTHYCVDDCFYKDKARECGEKCTLPYPHESQVHNCQKQHYCKEECSLKGKKFCQNICNKIYGHTDNKHECGVTHYCVDDCFYKDIAKNCGGKCKLPFPHPNRNHDCQNEHKCKENCSLKDCSIPTTCNKTCSKLYHTDGEHICDKDKKLHKCNKKCNFNEQCNRNCSLPAGHISKCQCGECSCPTECVYSGKSRNCVKICKYKVEHTTHKCQENSHYCKHPCKYRNCSSSGCEQNCKWVFEDNTQQHTEQSEHVCKNSVSEHICNQTCELNLISGCSNNFCKFSITGTDGHIGFHVCNKPNHKCIVHCRFYGRSSNCSHLCKENVTDNSSIEELQRFKNHTNHICSLSELQHICNGYCTYYSQIGIRCNGICTKNANHDRTSDPCKCSNQHVCMRECKYYNNNECYGCQRYCNKELDHIGEHFCPDLHGCRGLCYLKDAKGCHRNCIYIYPHNQAHECEADRRDHICNKNCALSGYRNCKRYCNKIYGHQGNCSCLSLHYCNNNCSFNGCPKKCCLTPNHNGKCVCVITPFYHICNKQCPLKYISGGCRITCKLDFRHSGECKCFINEKDPHTCIEKCELREYEMDGNSNTLCGHVFNHREKNLYCFKCQGNCKMLYRGHLCGRFHKCKKKCNQKQFCFIKPVIEIPKEYRSNSNILISYKEAQTPPPEHYDCTIKIPQNEYEHSNNDQHRCDVDINQHKCGHQCKQCNNYCTKEISHNGLHECSHGNIVNSKFSIEGSNEAKIKKGYEYYKVKNEEVARIFYCNDYCIDQGQGHTHLVHRDEIENFNDERIRSYNNSFYECKCSYFWESILKFELPLSNIKELLDCCDCICPCKEDSPENHNYCKLKLWHSKNIPEDLKGNWISPEGHKFKCDHPHGIYSIFLIDQSGSMCFSSIKPEREDIKGSKEHNNMLGASIEALLKYCQIRIQVNRREKCALIGYENKATKIFKDRYIAEEKEIRDMCLFSLKASGGTVFKEAFIEAKKILDEIHLKREYIPVIILLTDGEDFYPNKTINYLKNEVSIFI